MAAPKENLLSLGHKTSTDRNTFTKQRAHSSKESVHRPLLTQNDFSAQQSHQHLRVMQLQQRWQELKERELTAQQHNRQLLQQFEKAQDTLREMLACNAAMKTIRMEYERYLEESTPRWQQQLKEKTQAVQRKRMEEHMRSCLNNTEQEQITKSSADQPSLSQGLAKKPQKVSAPHENNQNSHYSQGVSPHLPYVQSTWLTHPPSQTPRFPIRMPSQPQGSFHAPPSHLPPPSIFPHPHQFQLQQLASSSSHHYPWPGHDQPGWASSQPNYSWPWPTGAAGIPSGSGALWGQLYMEEPPHHERGADVETSRISTSKRERGGGSRSSHISQELDIKPVRLSNGHTESSESGRDSSQTSREKTKKEKRGKIQRTSSDRDRSSSHESSVTSSAIVIAGVAVAQSSESDTSSEQHSTSSSRRTRMRSGGFAAGLPRMEEVVNGRIRRKGGDSGSHNEESESTSEESVNQINGSRSESVMKGSPDNKSDSCGEEESKSVSADVENGDADIENQERSISAEESNGEEKNEEEELEDIGEGHDGHDDEEKENSQRNEEQEERNVEEDDGEVPARKNTANEEEEDNETGAEDELEDDGDDEDDDLKDEDGENRTQGSASASSEDEEDVSEEDENKMGEDKEESAEEEDGEGEEEEEEEEQRSNEVEEERDSEDSIISPQETRLKKIHIIPEEAAEDEEEEQRGSKTGPSDNDEDSTGFSEEDDIEELLAPQEQTKKKEEKELQDDNKPEATCDKVEVFQVELDNSTKTDHQSDSDEFDHFYD